MPRDRKGQPTSTAPGQPYGEAARQERAQQVAPLAAQPDPIAAAEQFRPQTVPLAAEGPPNEPLTAGMEGGAGPGPESLPQMPRIQSDQEVDAKLAAHLLPLLQAMSSRRQLSPSTVRFMKQIRSQLPLGFNYQQQFEDNR